MDSSTLDAVLHHPDIWPVIAPQGVEPFPVTLPDDCDVDWRLGGVIVYHPFRDGLKIHPNFLPGCRGRSALGQIRQSLAQRPGPIYAEIDRGLRHVRAFAVLSGFELIERGTRYLYRRSA